MIVLYCDYFVLGVGGIPQGTLYKGFNLLISWLCFDLSSIIMRSPKNTLVFLYIGVGGVPTPWVSSDGTLPSFRGDTSFLLDFILHRKSRGGGYLLVS